MIKRLTGFDTLCSDLGDIQPFRQGWIDNSVLGNSNFNGIDYNNYNLLGEWINNLNTNSDTLGIYLVGVVFNNWKEYGYFCVDSQRLPALYKFFAVTTGKGSLIWDTFSLFARVGHWANIFELSTKLHGGWITADDKDFSAASGKTNLFGFLGSGLLKIPDYDFEAEVT
jgi:hypothetical protein